MRNASRALPLLLLLVTLPLASSLASAQATTLESVRASGAVRCGVNPEFPGFSSANSLGAFSGFGIDVCRAVAAAVFGDGEAFEAVPVDADEQFAALAARRFDVLLRNVTWTLGSNARHGEFVGTHFHDGQGFMTPRQTGLRSALELDDRRICVERDTSAELNAADFFIASEIRYRPVYFDDRAAAFAGYAAEECDAITTDRASLAARRSGLDSPEAHVILPELISKEPFGPMVRPDDVGWENVVRWSLNCMIDAEELGIASGDVAGRIARAADASEGGAEPATSAVSNLLGITGDAGEALGLRPRWCADIVRLVGNYGEVYERHVGPDTPLGLRRGINALWSDGGLIHAPPVR